MNRCTYFHHIKYPNTHVVCLFRDENNVQEGKRREQQETDIKVVAAFGALSLGRGEGSRVLIEPKVIFEPLKFLLLFIKLREEQSFI